MGRKGVSLLEGRPGAACVARKNSPWPPSLPPLPAATAAPCSPRARPSPPRPGPPPPGPRLLSGTLSWGRLPPTAPGNSSWSGTRAENQPSAGQASATWARTPSSATSPSGRIPPGPSSSEGERTCAVAPGVRPLGSARLQGGGPSGPGLGSEAGGAVAHLRWPGMGAEECYLYMIYRILEHRFQDLGCVAGMSVDDRAVPAFTWLGELQVHRIARS